MPRDHLKQQNHPQESTKVKKSALNRVQKGPLFTVGKLGQENSGLPCLTSAANAHVRKLKSSATLQQVP